LTVFACDSDCDILWYPLRRFYFFSEVRF
jgi:hypothetical protein